MYERYHGENRFRFPQLEERSLRRRAKAPAGIPRLYGAGGLAVRAGEHFGVRAFLDRAPTATAVGSAEATGSHWVKRELALRPPAGEAHHPAAPAAVLHEAVARDSELPEPATTDDLQDWPAELIVIRVQEGACGCMPCSPPCSMRWKAVAAVASWTLGRRARRCRWR